MTQPHASGRALRAVAVCAAIALLGPGLRARAAAVQSFASPQAASTALADAVKSGDTLRLLAILGPTAAPLVSSGDPVQDQNARTSFTTDYAAKHSLTSLGGDSVQLVIGNQDWPLPIPIVKQGSGWRFDAQAGAQELVDRRIGRNELLTIRTLLSAAGAQQDYFQRRKTGTGIGAYAQRILSDEGDTNGLYWPAAAGETPSPLGPLIDEARDEGYPGAKAEDGSPQPYHGYLFRILTAQGNDALGGARSYIQNGEMTGGFAFLAWPAQYGSSGVTTFIMGPDGVVYQRDLGPDTETAAAAITGFDPDLSWARVDVKD